MVETLRSDLAAFADPGETVVLSDDLGADIRAEWTQGGRKASADIRLGIETSFSDAVVTFGRGEVSYRTFVAGAGMADLQALARNTAAVWGTKRPFVPSSAIDEAGDRDRADVVIQALARPGEDKTSVVFLTADAGDGKTTLLRHVAVDRASAYLAGTADQLWLYVDAQGSRLARLDQALAQALDDLRAPFPYHATGSLVRTGAVVLVVDGFDELIGTAGTY